MVTDRYRASFGETDFSGTGNERSAGWGCAWHRLCRRHNRRFGREIAHCHIFFNIDFILPDAHALVSVPGRPRFFRGAWRGLRPGRAVLRQLLWGYEGHLLLEGIRFL